MRLKATYTKLPDGELTVSVDGIAGRENLLFRVIEGQPSVTHSDRVPNVEIGHLDAESLFFAALCPNRESLPDYAKLWFPLPIWLYSADMV